mmetsp:Transcript_11224/g.45659  ORF Transcript_11224/g.45659 Transcript_11224/m.45659 type:complete len:211 (-) Transcript_11224:1233-1865(-)
MGDVLYHFVARGRGERELMETESHGAPVVDKALEELELLTALQQLLFHMQWVREVDVHAHLDVEGLLDVGALLVRNEQRQLVAAGASGAFDGHPDLQALVAVAGRQLETATCQGVLRSPDGAVLAHHNDDSAAEVRNQHPRCRGNGEGADVNGVLVRCNLDLQQLALAAEVAAAAVDQLQLEGRLAPLYCDNLFRCRGVEPLSQPQVAQL